MTQPATKARFFRSEDHRDILEAALSAALGFAVVHTYIDWQTNRHHKVSFFEKFFLMLVVVLVIYVILRFVTKKIWPEV